MTGELQKGFKSLFEATIHPNNIRIPAIDATIEPFAEKLALACDICHATEQRDVLFLRKDEPQNLGPVDRNGCVAI